MEKNGVAMLSIAAEMSCRSNDDIPASTHDSNTTDCKSKPLDDSTSSKSRGGSSSIGSPPRSKLVLPDMTADVRKDLESGRLSSSDLPLSISKRPEWSEYPLKDISQPHPNDVLCGRGGGSNNHPGNEAFRLLVNEVKMPYVNCPKREKPLIARRVVEAVRNQSPPGRFLQKDAQTGFWNDIGDGRAREKTSQALREGAPVIRDMMDKQSPGNSVSVSKGKKKARYSPVADKEQVDCIDKVEGANETQMPIPKTVYQDYSNQPQMSNSTQPQMPLSFHMLNERKNVMPASNMYHNREEQDYCSSKPGPWQHQICNEIPSFRPPPPREEMSRFPGPFAPPTMQYPQHHRRRATMDYAPSHMRHPAPDSVPFETVRGLLMGRIDPVQLAYTILPPEDAAVVARLHLNLNSSSSNANNFCVQDNQHQQPSDSANSIDMDRPLPLCSVVSDGSSSPITEPQYIKEENQSSDDSSRQSNSAKARAVLPKKKRKFIG